MGRGNLRKAGVPTDADLAVSLEHGGIFTDVGAKRPIARKGQTVGKARVGYGGNRWYVAGAAERNPMAEHLFTVSFGAEFGSGRQKAERGK